MLVCLCNQSIDKCLFFLKVHKVLSGQKCKYAQGCKCICVHFTSVIATVPVVIIPNLTQSVLSGLNKIVLILMVIKQATAQPTHLIHLASSNHLWPISSNESIDNINDWVISTQVEDPPCLWQAGKSTKSICLFFSGITYRCLEKFLLKAKCVTFRSYLTVICVHYKIY